MGLKPIPKEQSIKIVHYKKIETLSREEQLLKQTCQKLEHFLDDPEHFDIKETNKLLQKLERSILAIQRKKKKLVEEANKKVNKTSARRRK